MPLVARLTGALNLCALQKAVDAVIGRHESLRTRFVSTNGEPAQVIENDSHLELQVEDLSALTLIRKGE